MAKIEPEEYVEADKNLNNIAYNLICKKRYEIANELLRFASETIPISKKTNEELKLIFIVNKAQTEKWLGNEQKLRDIIDSQDWSATSLKFKLAKEVLLDNFEEATKIMGTIGKSGEIKQEEYRDWPLFKEFRETDIFLKKYEEVFGESFENIEIPLSPFESILDLIQKEMDK